MFVHCIFHFIAYLTDQDRQDAEIKKRRRERDAKFKAQAESAQRQKKSQVEDASDSDSSSPETFQNAASDPMSAHAKSRLTRKSALPALLPMELLEAEPTIRPPTPPPETSESTIGVSKKRKVFDTDPKPAKDIKRGPVNVRVLVVERSVLPPRASQPSKTLKETWLSGRRGGNGSGGVQRRKLGGGFVRH